MNQALDTRGYDLFKAIVALILLILLIWLLLSGAPAPATPLAEPPPATSTPTTASPAETTPASQLVQPSPMPTLAPTETTLPTSTPTGAPTPTETSAPSVAESSATPQATPETTTAPAATETPSATPIQISSDCPLALPTRLEIGDTARVTSNLNMREAPAITSRLIRSNITGTQLTIVGGPVCEPYQDGAYLWWQLQRPDGESGWSAEGALTEQFYFLEPVE